MGSSALVKSQKRRAGLRLLNLLGIATCTRRKNEPHGQTGAAGFLLSSDSPGESSEPHVVNSYLRAYK
jgi:hypothetical protein